MRLSLPKINLTSLVWPGIVLSALVALFYITMSTKMDNQNLKNEIDGLNIKITTMQTQIDRAAAVNVQNSPIYTENKKKDQQLIKDSGRSKLVLEKPGLVEIKINKSFDQFMKDFENE
ncbi:hypothetical protein PHYNN_129 [Pantoea phage Phynn]|nr:hypothetical protein PHYNN_129 [Pantoea phage Phynn]